MLGALIRKEILDHLLSARFAVLAILSALFIWLGLFSGVRTYRFHVDDYRKAQLQQHERLNQIIHADGRIVPDRFYWGEMFDLGFLNHRPPSPLSAFVRGLESTQGRSFQQHANASRRFIRSAVADEPILEIFPPIDLSTVMTMVLSLFVLLLTYDAVCGEKESGTLRLVMSYSVPRATFLLAKVIGGWVASVGAFLPPLLLGLAVVFSLPYIQLPEPAWARLALILLAFFLYQAVLVCAGVLASAFTKRPATSFVLLLGFWVLTVIIVPRLSLITAAQIREIPSTVEVVQKVRSFFSERYMERVEKREAWARAYEERTGQPHYATPEGYEEYNLKIPEYVDEHHTKYIAERRRLEQEFDNDYRAWLDLGITLARISPSFALHNAAVRLAGTGLGPQRRFEAACYEFAERFTNWNQATFTRDQLRRLTGPPKYRPYEWDVGHMPRFDYALTWPEEEVTQAMVDFGVMALWGLLFFAAASVAVIRYDLR